MLMPNIEPRIAEMFDTLCEQLTRTDAITVREGTILTHNFHHNKARLVATVREEHGDYPTDDQMLVVLANFLDHERNKFNQPKGSKHDHTRRLKVCLYPQG